MRRAAIVATIPLVLFGLYSAGWFFVADRMAAEVTQWAEQQRPHNLEASWTALQVGGYPLAFRIEMSGVRLRDTTPGRPLELRAPLLAASARPWNFRVWEIDAPDGLAAIAGPAEAPAATLTAEAAGGEVLLAAARESNVVLDLERPALAAGTRVAARKATVSFTLPQEPPRTHSDTAFKLAVDMREVGLPQVPPPLRGSMDEVAVALKVLGAIPDLPPRRAAEIWRAEGGTIELERVALRWGELAVAGSGTVALDRDMQPEGAFSGSVQGYTELIAALSEAGVVRAGEARVAGLALALLSKPAANGKPEIATSFTIQNGEMFLGPAKLGRLPHLSWE